MGDPNVKITVTADGSQAGRELSKSSGELLKIGTFSVTVGSLLGDLARKALSAGKDLARFPLDAALATGRYVEQLENLTTETGLAAEEQQAYDVILNRTGLGLQDLSGIWRILSQNVIAARDPMSDAAAKFRQLGIELNGSEGPNEVLQLVAERLAVLPDGFQKNALATELLGKSGAHILPALKEGLAGAANEAKRLGTILDSEARAKAAAFDLATDDLSMAWQGLTHQIGVLAAPVLTDLTRNLTEATAKTSKWAAELSGAKKEAEGLTDAVRRMGPGATQFVPPPGLAGGGIRGTAKPPTKEERDALGLIEAQDQAARAATTAGARQEALGRAIILRSQQSQFNKAHMAELQPALASTFDIDAVMAREKVDESSRARPDTTGFNEIQKGVASLRELMPSNLDANELLQNVLHNLDAGHGIVTTAVDDYKSYREGLGDAAESARALESSQAELYATESGFIGAADAARRVSFNRIEAEEAQKRQLILDTFGESARGQQKLLDLETQTDTQRRAVIRQYPDFWEQQLQAVVNSNSFSLGSIVSTWSSGLATAVVQHKNFNQTVQAAWESTQVAVLQAGINTFVQWGTAAMLSASREIALKMSTEAAKTAAAAQGTAMRETIAAGEAVTTEGIFAGMSDGILGTFTLLAKGIVTLGQFALTTIMEIAGGIGSIISAIGSAMTASGILAPLGIAMKVVAAGLSMSAGNFSANLSSFLGGADVGFFDNIKEFFGFSSMVDLNAMPSSEIPGAASAAGDLGSLGFAAEGGIFRSPFVIAEAGTPEVAIPLDQRGKRFMNQLGFGGAGGEQRITVQVGDDVLVEKVLRGMPRMVHMRVGA